MKLKNTQIRRSSAICGISGLAHFLGEGGGVRGCEVGVVQKSRFATFEKCHVGSVGGSIISCAMLKKQKNFSTHRNYVRLCKLCKLPITY